MNFNLLFPLALFVLLTTACTDTRKYEIFSDYIQTTAHEGWYRQHEGNGLFQACGDSKALRVNSKTLLQKAKAFDLQPEDPIYVRLEGKLQQNTLIVTAVIQFGSSSPIRNCALTGIVTNE